MSSIKCLISLIWLLPAIASSAIINTGRGKIDFTEGHTSPNCRTVNFVENETGAVKRFRIKAINESDVNSVVLTALVANNDVVIWYDESITTGCGSEPAIYYIRIFSK